MRIERRPSTQREQFRKKTQSSRLTGYPASTKENSPASFDHWLPHWMGGSGHGEEHLVRAPMQAKFGSLAKDKV